MQIQEAKAFVNSRIKLRWMDRKGEEIEEVVDLYDVTFVPLYGPCMITTAGEIRLDRIVACEKVAKAA
jgi:hypothetical protein